MRETGCCLQRSVHPVLLSRFEMEHESLTRGIIGGAMRVHGVLGPGFLESVYQKALAWELCTSGFRVEREKRLVVRYRDALVGEFTADLVVDGCVLIETKAVRALARVHEVQLVNYLTATGIEVGLLLNFGADRLEFRRKTRTYRARAPRQDEQDRQDDVEVPASASNPHPVDPVHPVQCNGECKATG